MKRVLWGGVTIFVVLGLVAALVLYALSDVQTSAAQAASTAAVQTASLNVTLALCLGSLVGLLGLAAAAGMGVLWLRLQWLTARAKAEKVKVEKPVYVLDSEPYRPVVRRSPARPRLNAPSTTAVQSTRRRRRVTLDDLNRMRRFWE